MKSIRRYVDIPKFPKASYQVNVTWRIRSLETWMNQSPKLILEPDYQRGHVWSDEQRTAYVEYGLMGGENSMGIVTNCPGWTQGDTTGPFEMVDGLQRVTAVLKFLRNEITAFGTYHRDFEDSYAFQRTSFLWRVTQLQTRAEVLKLYLLMNSGGVVHSKEEIERVRKLLSKEIT